MKTSNIKTTYNAAQDFGNQWASVSAYVNKTGLAKEEVGPCLSGLARYGYMEKSKVLTVTKYRIRPGLPDRYPGPSRSIPKPVKLKKSEITVSDIAQKFVDEYNRMVIEEHKYKDRIANMAEKIVALQKQIENIKVEPNGHLRDEMRILSTVRQIVGDE